MLQIAKILKSNGTDGGLLIGMRDIDAEDINLKEPVFIEFDGLPVPFFIQDITPRGTFKAIIHINDVSTLQDAEEIVGRAVYLDSEPEEEEVEDFLGWTVLDKGKRIGEVTGMEYIPGNPCLYVRESEDSEEFLIPLHEDFILDVDPSSPVLNLDLPEGLY